MVGRAAERMALADALQKLQRGHSGVIIIEGEAGIAKSRLLAEALAQAQTVNVPSLVGAGGAIEKNTTYHAWKPIFRDLFGLAEGLEAKSFELRATVSLSRLWQAHGKQKKARHLLAEIYGWFAEGFETVDLQAAKALLEALHGAG